jgi:hypothetical protein
MERERVRHKLAEKFKSAQTVEGMMIGDPGLHGKKQPPSPVDYYGD